MTSGPDGPGEPAPAPLRVGLAVPAAGSGRRMGGARKPWLTLLGEPLLVHALRPFLARGDVVAVALALATEDAAAPPAWIRGLDRRIRVVPGGATRADSVKAALAALPDDLDVIVVHDAARPLVSPELVDACVRVAASGRGAVAGHAATDTLKEVDGSGRVVATPDRARFWHAQTPQAFPAAMLRGAYAQGDLVAGATDDASLVERAGGHVVMVEAPATNLKVTRPEDLPVAELLLRAPPSRGPGA